MIDIVELSIGFSEVLMGVQDDNLGSLVSWLDDNVWVIAELFDGLFF